MRLSSAAERWNLIANIVERLDSCSRGTKEESSPAKIALHDFILILCDKIFFFQNKSFSDPVIMYMSLMRILKKKPTIITVTSLYDFTGLSFSLWNSGKTFWWLIHKIFLVLPYTYMYKRTYTLLHLKPVFQGLSYYKSKIISDIWTRISRLRNWPIGNPITSNQDRNNWKPPLTKFIMLNTLIHLTQTTDISSRYVLHLVDTH